MARFRYRMQNILNVKEKLESQARNEFAIAAAVVNEEEAKLQELIRRREGYEKEVRRLSESTLDINALRENQNNIEVMKYLISEQRQRLQMANKQLEIARQKLTTAMQDRKTHEKLKEKEFEIFKAEEAQKESKEIDELVSFRHGDN